MKTDNPNTIEKVIDVMQSIFLLLTKHGITDKRLLAEDIVEFISEEAIGAIIEYERHNNDIEFWYGVQRVIKSVREGEMTLLAPIEEHPNFSHKIN